MKNVQKICSKCKKEICEECEEKTIEKEKRKNRALTTAEFKKKFNKMIDERLEKDASVSGMKPRYDDVYINGTKWLNEKITG